MIKLKVAEAIQDDVNQSVVKIGSKFMKYLKIKPGDFVELEGKRKTVAIAHTGYPGDRELNIIRMDSLIRKNAKTSIGALIKVRKTDVKEAKRVIIAPTRKEIIIRISPHLLRIFIVGRPIVKGDIVPLVERKPKIYNNPLFKDILDTLNEGLVGFGNVKVKVVQTEPKGKVIGTDYTTVLLQEKNFVTAAEEYVIKRTDDYKYKIQSEKDIKKLIKLKKEVKNLKVVITKPVLKQLEKSKTQLLKLIDKKIKKMRKK